MNTDSLEKRNSDLRAILTMSAALPAMKGPPSGYAYSSIYEYVLKNGHSPSEIPLSIEERAWFTDVTKGQRYPIKQCFANSQTFTLAVTDEALRRSRKKLPQGWRLSYVEGYVLPDWIPMPIHHGWVELNGKVIDLTLRYRDLKRDRKNRFYDRAIGMYPGRAYMGVMFGVSAVLAHVVKYNEWGTLLDNWHDGHALLRAKEISNAG